MTSKVTVEAQSHPCEVRVMPRVGANDLWKTLSDETRRFAEQTIPTGEAREYAVHSGQSICVRELNDAAPKIESNNHDELRATPETAPAGRYLLRDNGYWDKPFEAELLEWSAGARLRLGAPGTPRWVEGRDIPFVVERLAQGTEARRAETGNTDSVHDGPVCKADAPKPGINPTSSPSSPVEGVAAR